ncbi:hypothetical protein JZ751_021534 [Albula glossodonta]|uniref:PDZ domain-containing protein n=1 Tax=Albula glossodonta TaxID=121402 RepID=A0A8T2NMY8_9TELE|nr:hypothetical protein JZ751_021534 [Albula glossodonta]
MDVGIGVGGEGGLAGKTEKQALPPPEPEPPVEEERELEQVMELLPRLCHLVRSETGYGFNLHSEKARPGQYIRSLDPGSPADRAGLRPQDRLIEVTAAGGRARMSKRRRPALRGRDPAGRGMSCISAGADSPPPER